MRLNSKNVFKFIEFCMRSEFEVNLSAVQSKLFSGIVGISNLIAKANSFAIVLLKKLIELSFKSGYFPTAPAQAVVYSL